MADATANCLRLLKLMPFADLEKNMFYLSNFVDPDELVARVDVPLGVATDTEVNEKFLTCDYNRDDESHRSPHTNKYFPPLEDVDDPMLPTPELRAKETLANEIFGYYVLQYYGRGALSSVYFFDIDGKAFGACWLVKKSLAASGQVESCVWDAKHIFEVQPGEGGRTTYRLQSNIILSLKVNSERSGTMNIGGHVQKTHASEGTARDDEDHIGNMGRLLEASEQAARGEIDSLYVGKMAHVASSVRDAAGTASTKRDSALASDLASFLKGNMGATHK